MAFPASPTVGQQYTTPGGTTYEYSADGAWRIAPAASGSTSVLTNNGNGTFTHDDGTGNSVTIDLPAQVATHASGAEAASIIDTGWDGIANATAANISGLSGDETVLVEMDDGTIRQFQLSDLPVGGTSDASQTVKGVVEIASTNETRDGTALGATGAELAMNPDRFFNLPNQGAAVDGTSDRLLIKDDSAGQVRWVLIDDLPGASITGPTAGTADSWFFGSSASGNWPAGPTTNGYWHAIASPPSDGSLNFGFSSSTVGSVDDGPARAGIALPGSAFDVSSPGGGGSFAGHVTGWWVALP